MTKEKIRVAQIAGEILHYFNKNPRAADSLEGILKWWLTSQRGIATLDIVELALQHLIKKGRVKKQTTTSGEIIYSTYHDLDS